MGNLEGAEERGMGAVYASVSWPAENLMKIEGLIILDDQSTPVVRVEGSPTPFKIDRSKKNLDKYLLGLLACKGDASKLMKLSPEKIFLLDDKTYRAALRKWGVREGVEEIIQRT